MCRNRTRTHQSQSGAPLARKANAGARLTSSWPDDSWYAVSFLHSQFPPRRLEISFTPSAKVALRHQQFSVSKFHFPSQVLVCMVKFCPEYPTLREKLFRNMVLAHMVLSQISQAHLPEIVFTQMLYIMVFYKRDNKFKKSFLSHPVI